MIDKQNGFVEHSTFSIRIIKHSTLNIQHSTFNIQHYNHSTLNINN